jgi:uncharacterized membrane protein YeiH
MHTITQKNDSRIQPMKHRHTDTMVTVTDLAGVLLFAVEGASAAVLGHLDLFGMMVLAFVSALGGGIIRDVLIGAVPPAALRDWRYGVTAFIGAALVFFLYSVVAEVPSNLLMILDAAALSLFAIAGAEKALMFDINPFIAVMLGTITAVGGGTLRDILLAQVPRVLESHIYAVAAMAGAAVMVIGVHLKLPRNLMAILGGVTCFVLRVTSVWQHWNLPKVMPH